MSCDDGESMAQCGDCGQAIPASHMHCKDCAEYGADLAECEALSQDESEKGETP